MARIRVIEKERAAFAAGDFGRQRNDAIEQRFQIERAGDLIGDIDQRRQLFERRRQLRTEAIEQRLRLSGAQRMLQQRIQQAQL